jgi:hypothetical protein
VSSWKTLKTRTAGKGISEPQPQSAPVWGFSPAVSSVH